MLDRYISIYTILTTVDSFIVRTRIIIYKTNFKFKWLKYMYVGFVNMHFKNADQNVKKISKTMKC